MADNHPKHPLPPGMQSPTVSSNPLHLFTPMGMANAMMQSARDTQTFWLNTAVNACKPLMQHYTRIQVNTWLEQDARLHTRDDGSSAGGRYYLHMKEQMQDWLNVFPPAVRTVIRQQLMTNPSLQERMRDALMVEQFELIDRVIRERYPNDCGILFDEKYNHKFLTETSHGPKQKGEIVAVDADTIAALFKPGKGYPHIIVTSSHAQGETLGDVRSITEGIEAMARDSEGQELRHGFIDKGVKPGETLTIYACDVEQSPWRNGAALLRRMLELKKIAKTGEPDRAFNEVSPGAKRIAKLILKCIAEDPSRIDVDDPRPIGQVAANAPSPITLRADAVDIAHRFQLIGYSKGGNVVSDAMRYLIAELTAKRADGKDVFEKHPDSPTRDPNDQRMSTRNVRSIVRSIATLALASVEVALSDFDKEHGLRRVAINNQNDLISAHQNYEGSANDERWIIKGVEEHHGHLPRHMMGARATADEKEGERGYAHNDPRVARRLREFFAPNFGNAAIGRLWFNGRAAEGELTVEAATGTTDAQIIATESRHHIIAKALTKAGLKGVSFTPDPHHPGLFTLKCDANFETDARALARLRDAFVTLRGDAENKLIIAQTIIDEEIGARLAKALQTNDKPAGLQRRSA